MIYSDKGEASSTFSQFADSLMVTEKYFKDLSEGKKVKREEAVEVILRLSETAAAYRDTHLGKGKTDEGDWRLDAAARALHISRDFFAELDTMMGGPGKELVLDAQDKKKIRKITTNEEWEAFWTNIEKIDEQYQHVSKYYSKDECGEEERVRKKLQFLMPYEKDILTYIKLHPDRNKWPYAIREYCFYRMQIRVLDNLNKGKNKDKESALHKEITKYAREKDEKEEEKKLDPKEIDKGLTKEQLKGIEEIDRWFIRNYNNGGILGAITSSAKNNSIDLVNNLLSKPKRERLFIYYLIENKLRKTPNLMCVYQSQSSGYVPNLESFKKKMLAHKINFFARLSGGYTYMFKLDEAMAANEEFKDVIKDYSSIYNEKKETKQEKEKKEKAKMALSPSQRKIVDLAEKRHKLLRQSFISMSELASVEKQLSGTKDKKEKAKLEARVAELKEKSKTDYDSLLAADNEVGKSLEKYKKVHTVPVNVEKVDYNNKLKKRDEKLRPADVKKQDAGWFDLWLMGTAGKKIGDFSTDIYTGFTAAVDKGFDLLGLPPVDFWKLEDANLVDGKFWTSNVAGTVFSVAGNLASALAGIALTVGAALLDKTSSIQTTAFDRYFAFEDFYKRVKGKLNEKGRKIYDEENYKDQLRRRLAAAAGYSSIEAANTRIGQKYADLILDRLFNPDEVWEPGEKEAYIQMCKSFGQPYNAKKKKPDRDKLARKISGR